MYSFRKEEWLKALRSGEYKQARGDLKQSDSYTALGVLCDLYRKEMKKTHQMMMDRGLAPKGPVMFENPNLRMHGGTLPLNVEVWSGLDDNPFSGNKIMDKNDIERLSFCLLYTSPSPRD